MTPQNCHLFPNDYPYHPGDIRRDIGRSSKGTFIHLIHLPSGRSRLQDGLQGEHITMVERKLLALLHADVSLPAHDIHITTGWNTYGAYTCITHLPTRATWWQEGLDGAIHADGETRLLRKLEEDVRFIEQGKKSVQRRYVWADFNAVGWSGAPDDNSYYVLRPYKPNDIVFAHGLEVMTFDFDNGEETEIIGCEATIEAYQDGWRASPCTRTWYSGPTLWE